MNDINTGAQVDSGYPKVNQEILSHTKRGLPYDGQHAYFGFAFKRKLKYWSFDRKR